MKTKKNKIDFSDIPELTKEDWKYARRVTPEETEMFRRAIEKKLGVPRPSRGRPPKDGLEKYQPIHVRIHPKALAWAKAEAKRRGIGYQTVINQTLLEKAA